MIVIAGIVIFGALLILCGGVMLSKVIAIIFSLFMALFALVVTLFALIFSFFIMIFVFAVAIFAALFTGIFGLLIV